MSGSPDDPTRGPGPDPRAPGEPALGGDALARELRAAWGALPAPRGLEEDGLPSEELEACDAATRAVVERLRAAWRVAAPAAPEVPFALRVARRAPARRAARRWRAAAVAAALLGLATWGALAARTARESRHVGPSYGGEAGAQSVAAGGVGARGTGEPTDVTGPSDLTGPPEVAGPREVAPERLAPTLAAAVVELPREQLRLRDDGVEFVTGAIRVVLVEPAAPGGDPLAPSARPAAAAPESTRAANGRGAAPK